MFPVWAYHKGKERGALKWETSRLGLLSEFFPPYGPVSVAFSNKESAWWGDSNFLMLFLECEDFPSGTQDAQNVSMGKEVSKQNSIMVLFRP